MIFQQGEIESPEELECMDSVIMLKPGAKNYCQIPVSNSSNHDIVLKKNIIIGRAEYINLIIPLPVKFTQATLVDPQSTQRKMMNGIQSSIAARKRTNQNTSASQASSGKRRQKLYQKQQQNTINKY